MLLVQDKPFHQVEVLDIVCSKDLLSNPEQWGYVSPPVKTTPPLQKPLLAAIRFKTQNALKLVLAQRLVHIATPTNKTVVQRFLG